VKVGSERFLKKEMKKLTPGGKDFTVSSGEGFSKEERKRENNFFTSKLERVTVASFC
jgi:hypothetical protein